MYPKVKEETIKAIKAKYFNKIEKIIKDNKDRESFFINVDWAVYDCQQEIKAYKKKIKKQEKENE